MPAYTLKNLKQIEDAAPRFGLGDQLEARFATKELGCEKTGIAYERLAPNGRSPFGHTHSEQEEIYVVVGGSGRVKVGEDVADLAPWDAVRVSPGAVRAFEAGPEGLEIIAFGSPRVDGDAEILQGWWTE